jgi:hypothetical protein
MLRAALCFWLIAAVVHAQSRTDACTLHGAHDRAEPLFNLRMQSRAERRSSGFWLLSWGIANVIGGALVAGIGHEHRASLAGGITIASFGAINALLSPGLLDLSGARSRTIEAERSVSERDVARLREDEIVSELNSAQVFAVNFGLDVLYIAAGALLYVIGRVRSRERGWEEGAGVAFAGEGLFLLGFDLFNWMESTRRAAGYRAL